MTIVYDNGEENYVQVLKYGETIDVETPEKEGFTFAGWEPELPETMPANDLTVKAKWSALPVYQVSFDSTGGSSVQTQNVIEGQKATRPADPTKQGYKFAGWFLDLSAVEPYDFDAGVYGPITLYAKWTEGTSSYKVEHYLQDLEGNYTILHDTEELEGTTNSLAEAVGLTLTGFEYNSELSTASGIIVADGSLVLKLYYTRNTYTITIDLNDGSTPYSVYRKYEEAVDIDDPTRTGYDFDEWEIVLPEEMTVLPETMPAENISLKALWNPAEVFYTVKHYKQNLDGSYSQADFSEELKALTGSMVFATPNEYTGFTFDGDNSITEGTVKADGTLELVLYYTRNQYTLTIKSENSDDLEETYLYEQPIEYPVLSRPGYEFVGWNTEAPAIMPAHDVTLVAVWEPSEQSYVINYYYEQTDGTYIKEFDEEKQAKTDTLVDISEMISVPEHYLLNGELSELTGTIPAEGTLELNVYFDRKEYTITFDSQGGSSVDPIHLKHGSVLPTLPTPEKEGYTFKGWVDENGNVVETMPTSDLTLKAAWEAIEYTITYVFYLGTEPFEGDIVNSNPTKYTITTGVAFEAPTGFDEAYFFVAWFTDSTFTTETTGFEAGQTGNKVFYGLLKSFEEAFEEDRNTLTDKYDDILTGEVTDLPALDLVLPNGTKVAWQSSSTAFSVNKTTGEVTITRPTDVDAIVTLTATLTLGNWYETVEFEFVVPVVSMFEEKEVFYTDFEDVTKGSYAAAEVTINGFRWNFDNALVGNLDGDQKVGQKSVRIQNKGRVELLTGITNLSKITFKAGRYGTDAEATLKINISKDSNNWVEIFAINLTKFTDVEVIIDYNLEQLVNAGITRNGQNYIQFLLDNGKRINIDELCLFILEEEKSDANKIAEDKATVEALSGEINAGETFDLITSGANGSSISWTANPTGLIDLSSGRINLNVTEQTTLTLTATLTLGELTETAIVTLTVNPLQTNTIAEILSMSLDSDVVVIGKVTGIGSNFYYITDENNDIILVYGSNSGVSLGDTLIIKGKRSEYQNCPQISNWEILSKIPGTPELPEVDGTITVAELAAITNTPSAPFNQYLQVFAKRLGNYLTDVNDSSIKISVYADTSKLPEEGTIGIYNIYFYGFSSSGEPRIAYFGLEGEFNVPELSDEDKIDLAIAEIEITDGQTVTGNLVLPTTGLYGVTITWESDNPAINTENGEVIRPAAGESDVEVTLTATFSLNGEEKVVEYIVTVLAEEETGGGSGFAEDLFISEYIEGSSNNKAIEIFNGTGQTVDLSQYTVELYANGSSNPTNTQTLTGTLGHGEVYIIFNSGASEGIKNKGNISSSIANFNGDDALLLKKNGVVIDSFGQVGFDPGTAWSNNGISTVDKTLVRKPNVSSGRTDYDSPFDPSIEWIAHPVDTFTFLGSHEF
ncbi:MAG TPA: InlB B-repeat-containing protein, partial [Bacilli bacterium]|nr:InlB B-repeat-containing protein [Bacilli bacterium]